MIASSLRNCSLNGGGGGGGGRRRGRRAAAAEGSDDSEGVTVELNSEVALPYHWEQCLDIRVRLLLLAHLFFHTCIHTCIRRVSFSSPIDSCGGGGGGRRRAALCPIIWRHKWIAVSEVGGCGLVWARLGSII
jgi:hypothetical protein